MTLSPQTGDQSMLLPSALVEQARTNIHTQPWAAQVRDRQVEAAAPWVKMTDDELWGMMFSPTITRSWMVLSNGECPACQKSVPMYNWEIDAMIRPWKTRCPHCQEIFPKNDFATFYRSGLDDHGIFNSQKADRTLLFNTEHPDPQDPLYRFGVDDGEGFVLGDKRWRFIGAYLIYGQWKQAVLGGIRNLADAYVLTGDPVYAHKAAILLDRVADLYPLFDHNTQAWVYETTRTTGYVSTWHDACEETRELALAYDQIRDALTTDPALADFLSAKARQYKLNKAKSSGEAIRRNIESGILLDVIANTSKIHSNYPRTEITLALIHRILGTPEHLKEAEAITDSLVAQATAVDGVTGEKGLANYSAGVIQSLAQFLAQMDRAQPGFLEGVLKRNPALRQTFRFFIDTWCLEKYYPLVGDTGWFAGSTDHYVGVAFTKEAELKPSTFNFLWRLYELTGDEAYVQVLYHANRDRVDNLPYDLFVKDPAVFQKQVADVIARHGATPKLASVDKKAWHLAILRSGAGDQRRAAWLSYDSGGRHSHASGLNLGLFAYGLDLMPDMGYPPVQFGGWNSPQATWYTMSAAHNTVVIDGKNHIRDWSEPVAGRTTLWAEGASFRAIRVSAPNIVFAPTKHDVFELYGSDHGTVGFYTFREGCIGRVRVYTRLETPSGKKPAEWVLQFEDTFNRNELGPDWKVLEGHWRVEGGRMVGDGLLICNRKFSGNQRLEFEASSPEKEPCDLSAFLAGNEAGFLTGAFFGFGSDDNRIVKLLIQRKEILRKPKSITPGKVYSITCRLDDNRLDQVIDGETTFEYLNTPEEARRLAGESLENKQFERTVAVIDSDLSGKPVGGDFYLVDIFRVAGGFDHAKFMHSHFGSITTQGLTMQPTPDYGVGTQMRNFKMDPAPRPGWSIDWTLEDAYHLLPASLAKAELHLRYTDLTPGAQAYTCEGWITRGSYESSQETWIPRVLTRRQNTNGPLASTFIGVIEPYVKTSSIANIRRLALETGDGRLFGEADVALEIERANGEKHLFISADVENPLRVSPSRADGEVLVQKDWQVRFDGEMALIRRDGKGALTSITLCRAISATIGSLEVKLRGQPERVEIQFGPNQTVMIDGNEHHVAEIRLDGKRLR